MKKLKSKELMDSNISDLCKKFHEKFRKSSQRLILKNDKKSFVKESPFTPYLSNVTSKKTPSVFSPSPFSSPSLLSEMGGVPANQEKNREELGEKRKKTFSSYLKHTAKPPKKTLDNGSLSFLNLSEAPQKNKTPWGASLGESQRAKQYVFLELYLTKYRLWRSEAPHQKREENEKSLLNQTFLTKDSFFLPTSSLEKGLIEPLTQKPVNLNPLGCFAKNFMQKWFRTPYGASANLGYFNNITNLKEKNFSLNKGLNLTNIFLNKEKTKETASSFGEKNVFKMPHRKPFFCYWLLPFIGLVSLIPDVPQKGVHSVWDGPSNKLPSVISTSIVAKETLQVKEIKGKFHDSSQQQIREKGKNTGNNGKLNLIKEYSFRYTQILAEALEKNKSAKEFLNHNRPSQRSIKEKNSLPSLYGRKTFFTLATSHLGLKLPKLPLSPLLDLQTPSKVKGEEGRGEKDIIKKKGGEGYQRILNYYTISSLYNRNSFEWYWYSPEKSAIIKKGLSLYPALGGFALQKKNSKKFRDGSRIKQSTLFPKKILPFLNSNLPLLFLQSNSSFLLNSPQNVGEPLPKNFQEEGGPQKRVTPPAPKGLLSKKIPSTSLNSPTLSYKKADFLLENLIKNRIIEKEKSYLTWDFLPLSSKTNFKKAVFFNNKLCNINASLKKTSILPFPVFPPLLFLSSSNKPPSFREGSLLFSRKKEESPWGASLCSRKKEKLLAKKAEKVSEKKTASDKNLSSQSLYTNKHLLQSLLDKLSIYRNFILIKEPLLNTKSPPNTSSRLKAILLSLKNYLDQIYTSSSIYENLHKLDSQNLSGDSWTKKEDGVKREKYHSNIDKNKVDFLTLKKVGTPSEAPLPMAIGKVSGAKNFKLEKKDWLKKQYTFLFSFSQKPNMRSPKGLPSDPLNTSQYAGNQGLTNIVKNSFSFANLFSHSEAPQKNANKIIKLKHAILTSGGLQTYEKQKRKILRNRKKPPNFIDKKPQYIMSSLFSSPYSTKPDKNSHINSFPAVIFAKKGPPLGKDVYEKNFLTMGATQPYLLESITKAKNAFQMDLKKTKNRLRSILSTKGFLFYNKTCPHFFNISAIKKVKGVYFISPFPKKKEAKLLSGAKKSKNDGMRLFKTKNHFAGVKTYIPLKRSIKNRCNSSLGIQASLPFAVKERDDDSLNLFKPYRIDKLFRNLFSKKLHDFEKQSKAPHRLSRGQNDQNFFHFLPQYRRKENASILFKNKQFKLPFLNSIVKKHSKLILSLGYPAKKKNLILFKKKMSLSPRPLTLLKRGSIIKNVKIQKIEKQFKNTYSKNITHPLLSALSLPQAKQKENFLSWRGGLFPVGEKGKAKQKDKVFGKGISLAKKKKDSFGGVKQGVDKKEGRCAENLLFYNRLHSMKESKKTTLKNLFKKNHFGTILYINPYHKPQLLCPQFLLSKRGQTSYLDCSAVKGLPLKGWGKISRPLRGIFAKKSSDSNTDSVQIRRKATEKKDLDLGCFARVSRHENKWENLQKKRRALKQRRDTEPLVKRIRFFPRPQWLRYTMYKKFLKFRHQKNFAPTLDLAKHGGKRALPSPQSGVSLPSWGASLGLPAKKLFIKNSLGEAPQSVQEGDLPLTFCSKNFSFAAKHPKRNSLFRNNKIKWSAGFLSSGVLRSEYKNGHLAKPPNKKSDFGVLGYFEKEKKILFTNVTPPYIFNEKEFYKISQSVLTEFKKGLWKSSWLRSNLNSYLHKIKMTFNQIKKTSLQWEGDFTIKKIYLNLVGLNTFSKDMVINSKTTSTFSQAKGKGPMRQYSLRGKREHSEAPQADFWYFDPNSLLLPSKAPQEKKVWGASLGGDQNLAYNLLKWESALKLSIYNQISYDRIREIISNIKANIQNNGLPKTPTFHLLRHRIKKPKQKQPPAIFLFANQFRIAPTTLLDLNKLHPFLTMRPFGNMARKRVYWALNKMNMWHYKNINKKKYLWANQKQREQYLSNKTKKIVHHFMTTVSSPISEKYHFKTIPSELSFTPFLSKFNSKEKVSKNMDSKTWSDLFNIFLKKQKQKENKMGSLGFGESNSLISFLFSKNFRYTPVFFSSAPASNLENKPFSSPLSFFPNTSPNRGDSEINLFINNKASQGMLKDSHLFLRHLKKIWGASQRVHYHNAKIEKKKSIFDNLDSYANLDQKFSFKKGFMKHRANNISFWWTFSSHLPPLGGVQRSSKGVPKKSPMAKRMGCYAMGKTPLSFSPLLGGASLSEKTKKVDFRPTLDKDIESVEKTPPFFQTSSSTYYLFLLCTIVFHLCSLFSLANISQIRSVIKFLILFSLKFSFLYLELTISVFKLFGNLKEKSSLKLNIPFKKKPRLSSLGKIPEKSSSLDYPPKGINLGNDQPSGMLFSASQKNLLFSGAKIKIKNEASTFDKKAKSFIHGSWSSTSGAHNFLIPSLFFLRTRPIFLLLKKGEILGLAKHPKRVNLEKQSLSEAPHLTKVGLDSPIEDKKKRAEVKKFFLNIGNRQPSEAPHRSSRLSWEKIHYIQSAGNFRPKNWRTPMFLMGCFAMRLSYINKHQKTFAKHPKMQDGKESTLEWPQGIKLASLEILYTFGLFGVKLTYVFYALLSKCAEIPINGMKSIYVFLEKPSELLSDWITHLFLIEILSDLTTIIPENADSSTWNSFTKFAKSSSGRLLPVVGSLFEKRFLSSFELLLEILSQPDTDLMGRQKKGQIFGDIWGEELKRVADKNNINMSLLANKKEDQSLLLSQLLEEKNHYFGKRNQKMYRDTSGTPFWPSEAPQKSLFSAMSQPFTLPPLFQLTSKVRVPNSRQQGKLSNDAEILQGIKGAFNPLIEAPQSERKRQNNSFRLIYKKDNYSLTSQNYPQWGASLGIPRVNRGYQNIWRRWSANQFMTYKGKDSDLFIQAPPEPKSLKNFPLIKHYNPIHSPIGTIICQIYSGIFYKQTAKNFLVVGTAPSGLPDSPFPSFDQKGKASTFHGNSPRSSLPCLESFDLGGNMGDEKSLLIQSLAGETEMKIIRDNANRYNFTLGIKSLRNVFDALALYTPLIFLIEDIHVIGERRPLLVSEEAEPAKAAEHTSDAQPQDEKNLIIYQLTRHSIMHYKKPFRGDFSFLIPTNHYSFDLFLGVSSPRTRRVGLTPLSPIPLTPSDKNKTENFLNKPSPSHSKGLNASTLQLSSEKAFAPPSTAPYTVLLLKEEKKFKPKKLLKELPWIGFSSSGEPSSSGHSEAAKMTYSIRLKVALLAHLAVSNLSVKLNMITDLLVIIDSVRSNRGFVVFATTHTPSILDPALRRPGRLDETIALPFIPKLESRWEIVKSNFSHFNQGLCEHSSIPYQNSKGDSGEGAKDSPYLIQRRPIKEAPPSFINGYVSSMFIPTGGSKLISGFPLGLTVDLLDYGLFNFSLSSLNMPPFKWKEKLTSFKKNHLHSIKNTMSTRENQTFILDNLLIPSQRQKDSLGGFATNPLAQKEEKYSLGGLRSETKRNGVDFKTKKSFLAYRAQIPSKQSSYLAGALDLNQPPTLNKNSPSNLIFLAYSKIAKILINSKFAFNYMNLSLFSTLHSKLENQTTFLTPHFSSAAPKEEFTYLHLYTKRENFQQFLMGLFAAPVTETLASSGKKRLKSDKSLDSFNRAQIPVLGMWSLQGIDKTWRAASSLIFSLIEKRVIYKKNFIIPKLLQFFNAADQSSSLRDPPSPPTSFLLLPAKRYENFKRTFLAMQNKETYSMSINEKIHFHQKRILKQKLYSLPINFSPLSPQQKGEPEDFLKNSLALLSIGNLKTFYGFPMIEKPTSINLFYRNRLLNRHRGYLNNQWWNGQLYEHNVETTFLSDVDWRSNFISSLRSPPNSQKDKRYHSKPSIPIPSIEDFYIKDDNSKTKNNGKDSFHAPSSTSAEIEDQKEFFGDILIDFPDFDQHYNPRNRRWILNFGYWSYWYNYQTAHNNEIYSYMVTESFQKTYLYLNSNREIMDYLVTKLIKYGLIKEMTIIDGLKRF